MLTYEYIYIYIYAQKSDQALRGKVIYVGCIGLTWGESRQMQDLGMAYGMTFVLQSFLQITAWWYQASSSCFVICVFFHTRLLYYV